MSYAEEICRQEPMSLAAAARAFGRIRGRVPHVSTVWRWCTKGVRGVRLQSYVVGGTRVITAEAIDRFLAQTSEAAAPRGEHASATDEPAFRAKRMAEIRAARGRLHARCFPARRATGGQEGRSEQPATGQGPSA
jgi:hypothetical protein